MPVQKSIRIALPGVGSVDIPAAVFVITRVAYDEIAMSLSYRVVAWKDADTWKTYQAALADALAKQAAMITAQEALDSQRPGPDDTAGSASLKAKEDASGPLRVALLQAQIDSGNAVLAMTEIVPIIQESRDVSVPTLEIGDLLTDGRPDLGKLHAREKVGALAGATDC